MKRTLRDKLALWLGAVCLAAAGAQAASISGTVSDNEGAALAGAQLTARQTESSLLLTAISKEDGSYLLESVPAGIYTIIVRKAGFADFTQENFRAEENGATVRLNFRLRSSEGQTVVRGDEELNPNVFVLKLDTNEVLRELRRRGAAAELPREFRADQSTFGTIYSQPLRAIDWVKPRAPLRAFHGTLYEGHQNNLLAARTFFTVGKFRPSRRNQYGFTMNGAIVPQKFSASFAWSQLRDTGFVNGNVTLPEPEERTPLTTDPALGAVIQALFEAYPHEAPNLTTISPRLHNSNGLRDIANTAFSTRLDFRPRTEDQIAFEQRYLDDTEKPFEIIAGQNPLSLLRPQSYHLSLTHAASPATLWRFSYHFDRLSADFEITERLKNLLQPLGYTTIPNFGPGDYSSIGPGADYPFKRVENRHYFSPEMTRTAGRHTLTAGAMFNRVQFNDSLSEDVRGTFNFARDRPEGGVGPVRTAAENFRLGLPSSFEIVLGNAYRGFRHWEQAYYFQDTFRLRPQLTLSWGLRYEFMTKPYEVNNLTPVLFDGDHNNFAPQFGFAWNPRRSQTTVRGGFGVAFGPLHPILYSRARFNPPALRDVNVPSPSLLNPLAGAQITAGGTERSEQKTVSPDLASPYSYIYTLQIQRELPLGLLLNLGYAGERTFKLPNRWVFNRAEPVPGIPTETRTIVERRPNPNYLQMTTTMNGVIAYFDAFQVALNRRLARGLALNLRYTFSKSISTVDTTFAEIETGAGVPQTGRDLIGDMKGVSKFDTPHSLTVGYTYEVPKIRSQLAAVSHLFGGWRISGTTTFKSGTPSNLTTGSDSPGFGNVDGVRGSDRPNLLDPAILGRSFDNPDASRAALAVDTCQRPTAERPYMLCKYFDTNLPPAGRGNIGYNVFRSDGTDNFNVALEREIPVREAAAVLVRSEFINFFNHAQFAEPNLRMSSDTFGYITNTANRGRIIQLFMRLRW